MPGNSINRGVVVTAALQNKLRVEVKKTFDEKIPNLIREWFQNSDIYGNPPDCKAIRHILYDIPPLNPDYGTLNSLCLLLLGHPYRNQSAQTISPAFKLRLVTEFEKRFRGSKDISWNKFYEAWWHQFQDSNPPRRQTLDKFFKSKDRDSCEYWIIDGLCRLLLDSPWEECGDRENINIVPLPDLYHPDLDTSETRWVGREQTITTLKGKILDPALDCRMISILGITGIGKTALAARLLVDRELQSLFPFSQQKVVSFDRDEPSFDLITKALLGEQSILSSSNLTFMRLGQDNQLLERENVVATLVTFLRSRSCLLILDMFEEAIEGEEPGVRSFKDPRFQEFFERLLKVETLPSRIIITSQEKLPCLLEGRHSHRHHLEVLKGLEEEDALELFRQWEINFCSRENETYLRRIIKVYEAHPLALRVIAGEMRGFPYQGDVKAYWHEYGNEIEQVEQLKNSSEERSKSDRPRLDRYSLDLESLVKTRIEKTFDRLYRTHPLAYQLLCMGAVYRCPVERQAWLVMLSEQDRESCQTAFNTLILRFLLESEKKDERVLYRLHNLIRRVALDHLSQIEEYE